MGAILSSQKDSAVPKRPENEMSKMEALLTTGFGIILPTVDVLSDLKIGLILLTKREWVCYGFRISGGEILTDERFVEQALPKTRLWDTLPAFQFNCLQARRNEILRKGWTTIQKTAVHLWHTLVFLINVQCQIGVQSGYWQCWPYKYVCSSQ